AHLSIAPGRAGEIGGSGHREPFGARSCPDRKSARKDGSVGSGCFAISGRDASEARTFGNRTRGTGGPERGCGGTRTKPGADLGAEIHRQDSRSGTAGHGPVGGV